MPGRQGPAVLTGERVPTGRPVVHAVPALGWALVAVSGFSAVATLLWPGLLTGPAVMNGSAKGTALVVLLAGVPLLGWALWRGVDDDAALAAGLGASAYLLYNAVMFAFGTPFNHAFLGYVAMLGLAAWTTGLLLAEAWRRSVRTSRSHRGAADWILVVVALNALAWLARVVPAVLGSRPLSVVDGTGLATNPVFVQDLALWLPALGWLAWRLRAGDARAVLPAAGALTYWVLEAAGVAVDQWWGHQADPSSTVASAAAVPMFVVLGALSALALTALWRSRT